MKKLYLFSRICELWYKLTPRKIRRFWYSSALLWAEKRGELFLADKTREIARKEVKDKVHPSWFHY